MTQFLKITTSPGDKRSMTVTYHALTRISGKAGGPTPGLCPAENLYFLELEGCPAWVNKLLQQVLSQLKLNLNIIIAYSNVGSL